MLTNTVLLLENILCVTFITHFLIQFTFIDVILPIINTVIFAVKCIVFVSF